MKAILRSGFLALAIMTFAVPAYAGPFEDGKAAYDQASFGFQTASKAASKLLTTSWTSTICSRGTSG